MSLSDQLLKFNPHWTNSQTFEHPFKRDLFNNIINNLNNHLISLILGPRRTGKSVLLKQIIHHLIHAQNVNPTQILFYECSPQDTSDVINQIHDFLIKELANKNQPIYIFLDEIQFIPNYESPIKLIYDNFENIKFFLTGSLSLTYKRRMSESLAGRFLPYYLYPLKFSEYLHLTISPALSHWQALQNPIKPHLAKGHLLELNNIFRQFLKSGRLPQQVQLNSDESQHAYLQSIINQSLSQDAFDYFNIEQPQTLWSLFQYLQANNGSIVNLEKLSSLTQSTRQTISKYLDILEIMRLIYPLFNSKNILTKTNAARKIYLSSHFFLLQPKYDPATSMGFAVESYILERLLEKNVSPTFFHDRQKEIDFLVPQDNLALEVKFTSNIGSLNTLKNFCHKQKFTPQVITLDQKEISDGITYTPACLF